VPQLKKGIQNLKPTTKTSSNCLLRPFQVSKAVFNISAFLLPLLGIFQVCFLTGLLNVFSGIILFRKKKMYHA